MAITYFEKERIFKLDTPGSSYVIGIVDKENFVGHVYYGKKLRDANIAYLLRTGEGPFVPSEITEREYHSMIRFRWNMQETDSEITEEAVFL